MVSGNPSAWPRQHSPHLQELKRGVAFAWVHLSGPYRTALQGHNRSHDFLDWQLDFQPLSWKRTDQRSLKILTKASFPWLCQATCQYLCPPLWAFRKKQVCSEEEVVLISWCMEAFCFLVVDQALPQKHFISFHSALFYLQRLQDSCLITPTDCLCNRKARFLHHSLIFWRPRRGDRSPMTWWVCHFHSRYDHLRCSRMRCLHSC